MPESAETTSSLRSPFALLTLRFCISYRFTYLGWVDMASADRARQDVR